MSSGDKRLLAWVQSANLGQRGGSVLTLQDPREFEDGTTCEAMRCFANGTLHGGANLADGKLL